MAALLQLLQSIDWDAPARRLASVGIPAGTAHFVFANFAAAFLSWFIPHIPTVRGRNLYCAVVGIALSFYSYGWDTLFLVFATVVSYVFMLASRRRCGPVTWVFGVGFLLACHVLAGSQDRWQKGFIPFTGGLMTLVQRLTSIAYDYQDGDPKAKRRTPHAEECQLATCPGPIEYLGYLYYPGSVCVGPWMVARKYFTYIRLEGPWSRSAPRRCPSGVLPGLLRLLTAFAAAALFVTIRPRFPNAVFAEESFRARPMWYRLAYMWCLGFAVRCRFYFAWKIAEAGNCFSGLGFTGFGAGGRATWDGGKNVDIARTELPGTAAELAQVWNTASGEWLRFYLYERVCPPQGRALVPPNVALLLTQLVAGVWHGLRTGQLLFFAHTVPMLLNAKALFRFQRALPEGSKQAAAAHVAHTALSVFMINYLAASFIDLTWGGTMAAWGSIGFCGHWVLGGIFVLSLVVKPPAKPAKGSGVEVKKVR